MVGQLWFNSAKNMQSSLRTLAALPVHPPPPPPYSNTSVRKLCRTPLRSHPAASDGLSIWQAAGALWRRAPGAVAAGARGMQSGSDDRVIGPNLFNRIVRQYDFEGNLSRHMNPEIEKVPNPIPAPPGKHGAGPALACMGHPSPHRPDPSAPRPNHPPPISDPRTHSSPNTNF